MIAGGVVGGLPALYYLVQDPDGFLAHTLRYFTYAHHDYWQTLDEPKVMGMAGKLQIAEQMWLGGATLLAACLALYQFFVPLSSRERPEGHVARSEEHTSELQSLMRISYDVFCLKKKTKQTNT